MKWVIRVALTLVGLLVLGAAVLFAMGQRSGAGLRHLSIDIQAPRAAVFAFLNDHEKSKKWVTGLVEIRTVVKSDGVGGKEIWVVKEPGSNAAVEVTGTCTEYVPEKRITVALSAPGMFQGDQTYDLADLGNGQTRLTIDSRSHYLDWFARLMEPLITPWGKQQMVADLAHLKSLVEAR